MDKVVRVYASHADAEAASREAMRKMTPEERIAMVIALAKRKYGSAAERFDRVCRVEYRRQR